MEKAAPGHRKGRILAGTVGGVVLLVVLGVVLLPRLLETPELLARVQEELTRAAGMPVTVEGVSVRAWPDLVLGARGVRMGDGDWSAEEVQLEATWAGLREGRVEATSITVLKPRVRFQVKKPAPESDDHARDAANASDVGTTVPLLRVQAGTLEAVFPDGTSETWSPVNAEVQGLSASGFASIRAEALRDGAQVTLSGAASWARDMEMDLEVGLSGVQPGRWLTALEVDTGPVRHNGLEVWAGVRARLAGGAVHVTWTAPRLLLAVGLAETPWKGTLESSGSFTRDATGAHVERARVGMKSAFVEVSTRFTAHPRAGTGSLQANLVLEELLPLLAAARVPVPRALDGEGTIEVSGGWKDGRAEVEVNGTRARLAWRGVAEKPLRDRMEVSAHGLLDDVRAETWVGRCVVRNVSLALPGRQSRLEKVGASLRWTGRRLEARDVVATLDDANLDGELNWDRTARGPGRLSGKLHASRLDLDQLARPSESTTPTRDKDDAAPPQAPALDVALVVDELVYRRVRLKRVNAHLGGEDGQVELRPLAAEAWGGQLSGNVDARVRVKPVTWGVTLALQKASMETLLAELADQRGVMSGDGALQWTLQGRTGTDAARAMKGRGSVDITSVRWAGSRAFDALAPLLSAATGAPATRLDLATVNRIRGPLAMEDGKLFADGLILERPNGATLLVGSVDFDGRLDFHGTVLVSSQASAAMPRQLDMFRNKHGSLVIPFVMRGTLEKPVVTLDAAQAGKAALRDRLGVDSGGALAPLQDKVLDQGSKVLEGLFKRR